MKRILLVSLCGALCTSTWAEDAGGLAQQMQSFTIFLKAPVAEAVPLFGPVREQEWAPKWSPHFIHPVYGAQREGVVFTTTSHGKKRIWLLITYDLRGGRIEYVVVTPGFSINEIKIRLVPHGSQQCQATVAYRRSALAPEGNDEVKQLDSEWAKQQRAHWEASINRALSKGNSHD